MSISDEAVQKKYTSILASETKTAWRITGRVVEKPEISVWMILIPIIFVPYMQRYQRYKTISKEFTDGYLFTKEIALSAAYRIHTEKITMEQALLDVDSTINQNPDADPMVQRIYDTQKQEITHLITHYTGLLNATGKSYEEWVQAHYKTKENYLAFIDTLLHEEQKVSQAASHTFRREKDTEELPEIIKQLQDASKDVRQQEAERIFSA